MKFDILKLWPKDLIEIIIFSSYQLTNFVEIGKQVFALFFRQDTVCFSGITG